MARCSKFVPVLADKRVFDTVYESLKEGAKPVKISYSLVILPRRRSALSRLRQRRGIWRESRFELMEDKFVALPIFLELPSFCTDRDAVRDLFRYKTMTSEQAAVLLPVFGEWKGQGLFMLR